SSYMEKLVVRIRGEAFGRQLDYLIVPLLAQHHYAKAVCGPEDCLCASNRLREIQGFVEGIRGGFYVVHSHLKQTDTLFGKGFGSDVVRLGREFKRFT